MENKVIYIKKRIIFLLFLCLNAATASTCDLGCKTSTESILNYVAGHEYDYSLESSLNVAVHNGTEQNKEANANNQLKLNANVKLYAHGNCVYTLQLNNVKVSSSVEGVAKQQLQHLQYPIQFSMENNGKVQPNLCIKNIDGENHYALNIKRSIVSILQTHVADNDLQKEVDVYGVCNTRTSQHDGTIIKVRNLNDCQQREHINTGLVVGAATTVHEHDNRLYNTPYLQADYYKHTKVNAAKVVEQVTIDEIYRQGAGAHKSETIGANAKVRTVLKLVKSGSGKAPNMNGDIHAVSIKFDAKGIKESNLKNIQVLRTAFDALVPRLENQVEQGTAQQFAEIVRLMRTSDYDSLLELSNQKGLAHKVYLDALFRVGTAPAARAIFTILPKLNDKEQFLAVSALHVVQHVDHETIKAAAAILTNNQQTNNNIFLSIGHLVQKYCSSNTEINCGKIIEEISKPFVHVVKQCKATSSKEEENILAALKGIGNMKHTNGALLNTIGNCLSDQHDDISQRVRVAALQTAAAAASCNKDLQQSALKIIRDVQEDSEIRIEAYLTSVECVNERVVQTILDTLEKEPSQQLKGFIYTHLRSLRDSTDITREQQKRNLVNLIDTIPKKLPLNWRKFSRNEEFSYKLPAMGLSASGDAKVIYTQQQGFLPRSASLNVTSELFGHNFNIFQLNLRQENVEKVLEYYLGPKGLLNKNFDEVIKTVASQSAGHPRARRSLITDTQKFAKKYKNYGEKKSKGYGDTPLNFDLSLKVFGSELGFLSLGDNIPQTLEELMYHLTQIFENTKNELRDFSKQFHMHVLFLDSELLYATSAGVPLSLSAQGFATAKYDIAVKMDVDAILSGEWNAQKYRLKFVPSIDAEVQLRLGYITPVINSGVHLSTQLHTVTGSDIYLSFTNGNKGFKMELELPNEKIDLVHLQTSTNYFVHEADKVGSKLIPLTGIEESPATQLCFNQLEEFIGIDFCVSTNLVDMNDWGNSAEHPKSALRPIDFHLLLQVPKKLVISADHIENSQDSIWQLSYVTPGSAETHDTKISLKLSNDPEKKARIELHNPKVQLSAEVGIKSDAKELVLYAQYAHNNDKRRSKIGFNKVAPNEYEPVIEIQTVRGDVLKDIGGYAATGRLRISDGEPRTYTFDKFTVKHMTTNEQFTQLNGWIKLQQTAVMTEIYIASPNAHNYFIKSELGLQDQFYTATFFINNEETPENVVGGSLKAKVQPNEVVIKVEGKAQNWHIELKNDVKYQQSSDVPKIMSLELLHELSVIHKQQQYANGKLHVRMPTNNELNINAEIQKLKHLAKLDLHIVKNKKQTGDYLATIKANYNKHSVDITAKCDINESGRYVVDNKLITSWGTTGSLQGQVGSRFMPEDIFIDLNGNLQASSKQKPQQLHLKVIGGTEKTVADFEYVQDSNELVKFNGEWQHTADKVHVAKSNLLIKNVLSTKLDYKVAKTGKGELNVNAQLLKGAPENSRKLDLNSKFNVHQPTKYDFDVILLLNNDKEVPLFHIKTENIIEKSKFGTTNIIEVMNQKYELNAHANTKGEWRNNGELTADFNLNLPNGQVVEGSGKRKLLTNPKTGVISGDVEWSVTHKLADGKQRTLSATGKLEKLMPDKNIIINDVNCVYKNVDGKKLDVRMQMKHVPKNQGKLEKSYALDLSLGIEGELIPQQIHFTLKSDEYSFRLGNYDAKFNYGDKISALLKGNHEFNENKPFIHDLLFSVTLPQTQLQNINVHSNGKWIKPSNDNSGKLEHQFQLAYSEKHLEWTLNAEGNEAEGKYNMNIKSSESPNTVKLSGDFEKSAQKFRYSFNADAGSKYLKSEFDAEMKKKQNLNMHFKLLRDVGPQLELKFETDNNEEHYGWNVEGKENENNKYTFNGKIFKPASNKQGLSTYLRVPQVPNQIMVVCIFEKLGEGKGHLELEIAELFGLDWKSSMSIDVQEIENFNVELIWDSEKLKLKQYSLKIKAENGSKLHFNLKNAHETIVTGVLNQQQRKEGNNKFILEGEGQVEYRGEKKQGNYQLTRQVYSTDSDKELGVSYAFTGQFGAKNSVANLKLTNKEFNMKLSSCVEKNHCSNVQMQSTITPDEIDSSLHSLLILIDIRELGYPYEFELHSKTQRQGLKAQYNFDAKLTSNNNYRYGVIASLSSYGSGQVQLTLPKREILLKIDQQFPANQEIFGHYEQAIALWLDHKHKPDEVTIVQFKGDLQGEFSAQEQLNVVGSIKLEHPNMRSLSISGKLLANKPHQSLSAEIEVDVFKRPDEKLYMITEYKNEPGSLEWNIHHKLLVPAIDFKYNFLAHSILQQSNPKDWKLASGLEFSAKFHNTEELTTKTSVELTPEQMKLQVEALKESLLVLESRWHNKDKTFKAETTFQVLSQQPVKLSADVELSAVKFNLKRENSLEAEVSFKLGKDIILRLHGENDKKYVDGRVALDSVNFLQTHYEGNLEDIKELLERNEEKLQEQTKQGFDKMKQRVSKIGENIKKQRELLDNSIPDLSPLQKTIKTNLDELLEELEADPMVKQIVAISRQLIATIEKFVSNLHEHLNEFYKKSQKIVEDTTEKLKDIFTNSLLPLWEDFVKTMVKIISTIRVQLVETQVKMWEMFMQIVEKYSETFKPYGKILHDMLKTINDANQEIVKVLTDELKSMCNEISEFWKDFKTTKWQPFFERMQAQWKEWKVSENVGDLINQLIDQLHLLPQTPESSEFLQQLQLYINQKLNNEQTSTNLQSLLSLSMKAIQSLLGEFTSVYKQQVGAGKFGTSHYAQPLTHLVSQAVQAVSKLPTLFTLRFSLVNFLAHELTAGWHYDKQWQQGWYSLSLLSPFDMTARVLNGQQFVTFDGLYSEYKAENCRYILSQDSIDLNFTVVAFQQHNKLRAISLITRDNEILELYDNGNLKLNGNPIEYPYHGTDLHAWQIYYTVALRTQYGVEVTCVKDLSLCHITVNGFYAGRLRGVLGNGNTEKFDDRTLPEGTVSDKNTEVGGAYTLGKCTLSAVEEPSIVEKSEICEELFGWKSTLSTGFLFLDPTAYLHGCNAALVGVNDAEQQQAKVCEWALAYVSALRLHDIRIHVPNNCLRCGKNQPIEHELNVKLPGSKADILFVIDLETSPIVMDSLVKPLMQEIRETFKARSFTDVQVGVIAYNETQRYPALLTSNGGKLNYAGTLAEIDLSNAPSASFCKDCLEQVVGSGKVVDIFNKIENLFSILLPNAEKTAYKVALKYPFRAQASSVIVSIRHSPLSKLTMLDVLEAEIADGVPNHEKTILHLIAPIPQMSVEGITKEKLIGFNSRLIATLDGKDPKKRSKLQFGNNAGIDMILQTGGWIFNTEYIDSLKAQDQKKAVSQITNTIADTSFKTEQVTECKCESVYGMFAEYKCTVKSTNFVPNKKIKSTN